MFCAKQPLLLLCQLEYRRAFAYRWHFANSLFFFVLVISLFPLALSGRGVLPASVGMVLIWVSLSLSVLLSVKTWFQADFDSGLFQMALHQSIPLSYLVAIKMGLHWAMSGLPLLLCLPLAFLFLNLPIQAFWPCFLGLFWASQLLSILGGVGALLTLSLSSAHLLLMLLLLPLYLPPLLFGLGFSLSFIEGMPAMAGLYLLIACSLPAYIVGPYLGASLVKINLASS